MANGLTGVDLSNDLSECDPQINDVEGTYQIMVEYLHKHEFMSAIEQLPLILDAIITFSNTCKGSDDIEAFVDDMQKCMLNIETIEDNKVDFLEHV